jgi:flavin-dependent dehydrogenase
VALHSDILIAGGGPAGCAAAITLARRGYSVLLVERSTYDDTRIGETLTPRAQARLRELGVPVAAMKVEHLPAPGIMSAWGEAAPRYNDFARNPYGPGLVLARKRFDAALARSCASAGISVMHGRAVAGCHAHAGTWNAVLADGTSVAARFVIDATGRGAPVLGRYAGSPAILDRLIAVACIVKRPESCSHTWTLIEATPDGWWYSARLPDDRSIAVYLTDADLIQDRDSTTLLQDRLTSAPLTDARLGAAMESATAIRVAAMSCYRPRACGSNWLLAGDAAMTWDPLSGQGICNALESGMKAGTAVDAALRGDDAPLNAYSKWMQERFKQYVTARYRYYSAEQRWPQSPFWQRRHAVH